MTSVDDLRHVALLAPDTPDTSAPLQSMIEQASSSLAHPSLTSPLSPPEAYAEIWETTLLAASTSLAWNETFFHVMEPPGHDDFRAEVDRMLTMADVVLLWVDAVDGPRPEATYASSAAFAHQCRPIVVLQPCDALGAHPDEILDDLFVFTDTALGDDRLDVTTLYMSSEWDGAMREPDGHRGDMTPMFEAILEGGEPMTALESASCLVQLATLEGVEEPSAAIGRLFGRPLELGTSGFVMPPDGERTNVSVRRLYRYDGEWHECERLDEGELGMVVGEDVPGGARASTPQPDASSEPRAPSTPESQIAPSSSEANRPAETMDERYRRHLELAERAENLETQLAHYVDATQIACEQLASAERAIRSVTRVLALDPTRVEPVQSVVPLVDSSEDWQRLADAYRRSLDQYDNRPEVEDDVWAMLWHDLGHICHHHLEDDESLRRALRAHRSAVELAPRRLAYRETLLEVAASVDALETVEDQLLAIYRLDRDRLDCLERLGDLHLHRNEPDAALCRLRTCGALGGSLDDRTRSFVESFETGMYNSPEQPLDLERQRAHLHPPALDPHLNEVFRILFPILHNWTSEFHAAYGLERSDAIDLDTPLVFSTIYRDVATTLGWETPPEPWRYSDVDGIAQAPLEPLGVFVEHDLLEHHDERAIAFAIARVLFLLQPPYYLIGVRDFQDLEAFFVLALQLVYPEVELERDATLEDAFEAMARTITGEKRARLRDAVDAAVDESGEVDLGRWAGAVEAAADRVGFLFAGDLQVARDYLERHQGFSARSPAVRMRGLVDYSLSEDYLTLRRALGIDVS